MEREREKERERERERERDNCSLIAVSNSTSRSCHHTFTVELLTNKSTVHLCTEQLHVYRHKLFCIELPDSG